MTGTDSEGWPGFQLSSSFKKEIRFKTDLVTPASLKRRPLESLSNWAG